MYTYLKGRRPQHAAAFPRFVFPELRRNTIGRTCSVVHKNKIPFVRAESTGTAAQFEQLVITRFPDL